MCHAYVGCLIILIDALKMNVNLTFFAANLKLVYQFTGLMRELCMFFGFLDFLSLLVVHLKRKTNSLSFVLNSVL